MTLVVVRCTKNTRDALHQAGVVAAHRALARATNTHDHTALSIQKDPLGKPVGHIRGRPAPVALSISHTFPFALSAAHPFDACVGVDVERIQPFTHVTWHAFLTPCEQRLIAAAPAHSRPYLRTLAWSLKESTLKALGVGLRVHPRHVETTPVLLTSQAACISIYGTAYPAKVASWRIAPTHVITRVAFHSVPRIMYP